VSKQIHWNDLQIVVAHFAKNKRLLIMLYGAAKLTELSRHKLLLNKQFFLPSNFIERVSFLGKDGIVKKASKIVWGATFDGETNPFHLANIPMFRTKLTIQNSTMVF